MYTNTLHIKIQIKILPFVFTVKKFLKKNPVSRKLRNRSPDYLFIVNRYFKQ
jgi:hypothetical protein